MPQTFKKVKTLKDIKGDPRIERIEIDYDGRGKHMAECKDGFRFENERTIEIGNIKEICYSINTWLEKEEK